MNEKLRIRARAGAAIPWVVVGVASLQALAAVGLSLINRRLVSPLDVFVEAGSVAAYGITGTLIAARARTGHRIGWLFLGAAMILAFQSLASQYAVYAFRLLTSPLPGAALAAWIQSWLSFPLFTLFAVFLMLYPDGRLPSGRWRLLLYGNLAVLGLFGAVAMTAGGRLDYYPLLSDESVFLTTARPPLALNFLPAAIDRFVGDYFWYASLFLFAGALLAPLARYRRAPAVGRLQIRWLMWLALSVFLVIVASIAAGASGFDRLDVSVVMPPLLLLGFPLAVGLAILRHGLYDLDLIINRGLVFSVLTLALSSMYAVTVIVLQLLLPFRSELAITLSTLMVAALFNPLRRHIQAVIDRRFYRQKYDASRTLARFAVMARDELDLEQLVAGLSDAVGRSLQPAYLSVWLVGAGRPGRGV